MNNFLIIVVFAVIMIAFFLVGMSLTLIFKGHHIESEIADNPNMKKLGIKCASQQMRAQEMGEATDDCLTCSTGSCGSCTEHEKK
ncbi:MAG: hypothetical protein R3Y38_05265 [Rikenellaceae bacterium]